MRSHSLRNPNQFNPAPVIHVRTGLTRVPAMYTLLVGDFRRQWHQISLDALSASHPAVTSSPMNYTRHKL